MENAEYDSSRPLAEQVAQKIKDYILEEKLIFLAGSEEW